MVKRSIYLVSFVVFGLLLATLFHALVEMTMINLLTADYATWGLGLAWSDWFVIHTVGAFALWIASAWLGYRWGTFWWKMLYNPDGSVRKEYAFCRKFSLRRAGR